MNHTKLGIDLMAAEVMDDLKKCSHLNMALPEFDEEAASKMSSDEVRKRYPRISTTCPDCGMYFAVCYASFRHYIAGDW